MANLFKLESKVTRRVRLTSGETEKVLELHAYEFRNLQRKKKSDL